MFNLRKLKITGALLIAMILTASTALTAMAKVALDVSLVSQLGSAELAAFTFIFPIIFLLMSVGRGIYIATAARFSGRGYLEARRVQLSPLCHAIALSLLLGLACSLLLAYTLPLLLSVMGADNHQHRLQGYFSIWLWTVPMMFVSGNTFAVARNLGYLKVASIITLIATIAGIFASLYLIPHDYGEGALGIIGSAYSTLITSTISTAVSLVLVLCHAVSGTDHLLHRLALRFQFMLEMARTMNRTGLPVLLSNLLLFIFLSFSTRIFADYGEQATAAFGIIGRIEQVLLIFQTAFVTIAIPSISRRFSRGSYISALCFIRMIARMMVGFGSVLCVFLWSIKRPLITLLAPDEAVWDMTLFYLSYVSITTSFQGIFILATTAFNLLGQARKAMLWSAANYCVISPLVLFIISNIADATICLLGFAGCNLLFGALTWHFISTEIKQSSLRGQTT